MIVILITNIANALGEVAYRTVRIGDLDIFYREAGPKDGPTILLLHGLPSSSRMYQRLLESALASQYHLIAPDYPGFGHSSWPDHKSFAYTFDHLAKIKYAQRTALQKGRTQTQHASDPFGKSAQAEMRSVSAAPELKSRQREPGP